jgi:lantibiotic modifying enzyme
MRITKTEAYWMTWIPVDADSRQYRIVPASYDLYGGMPGEIICLTYLSQLSHNPKYEQISHKAINYFEACLDQLGNHIRNLGAFGGWGGIIYLMTCLSQLKNDSTWLTKAGDWLLKIDWNTLAIQEENHGLVNGAAGLGLSCLTAYKKSKQLSFIQLAERLAGWLLRCGMETKDQLKWKGISNYPLAGLSHGASGYALFFGRLYEITGSKKYKKAVHKILHYEDHLYDPIHKNWPDLRDFVLEQNKGLPYYSTAWSHGAPGIGMTRLELIKSGIRTKSIVNDLKWALETCIQNGFNGDHNLCYGAFGNLDLLINTASHFKNPLLKETFLKTGEQLVQDGLENGFRITRTPNYIPGLMNGLTGIIYQCLRLHAPEQIPSILTLSI